MQFLRVSPPSQMALLARNQLVTPRGWDSPEEKAAPGKWKKTAL